VLSKFEVACLCNVDSRLDCRVQYKKISQMSHAVKQCTPASLRIQLPVADTEAEPDDDNFALFHWQILRFV